MKQILKLSIGLAAAMVAANASAAITIDASPGQAPYAGPTPTFDFDSPTPEYDGPISNPPSVPGEKAVPFGSTGGYIAVGPAPNENNTVLDLATFAGISSISFLWGSVDLYNTLDVLDADNNVLASFTGGSFTAPIIPNGCQNCSNSNVLARLVFSGTERDTVSKLRFSSTQQAFEADNFAISAVPEPATWAMMILGFGVIGGAMRRRNRPVGNLKLSMTAA